ncbi:tellurite resistance/C4-dicarboxylate transporter family protein [Streptacidiphilus rugosus]|uniref:tellurite resistance/C4-dicarboxylate transporter family protein n=1 Tax=Streptacidiphilus rugosus TaxID=405783 RepID=UPI00068CEF20|nr:tellurite resistance/C4-dicarboxylate transporter family protein [Streptacidiphilus rugosus]
MNQTASTATTEPAAPTGWWARLPPAAGSAVMATGIVSVGLHLVHQDLLSEVLLVVAAAVWVLLAVAFALTFLRDRRRWVANADTPPALTAVAATTVLGTRLSLFGWQTTAAVLLAIAAVAWPGLLAAVLRHWQHHLPGVAFLVCVATQGLAVLSGTLALAHRGDWLVRPCLATFVLGLALYVAALTRFDLRQVDSGSGDQWIAAGALAISALAGSKLTSWPHWTGAPHATLRVVTLVLLALNLAWYVVLLVAEIRHPRLHYNIRRWATVFPLGMTAVATLSTSTAAGVSWLHPLGQVLLWIACAAWLVTAALLAATMTGRVKD